MLIFELSVILLALLISWLAVRKSGYAGSPPYPITPTQEKDNA